MGRVVTARQGKSSKSGGRKRSRLALKGELTINTAAENMRRLLDALGEPAGLEVDLSGVDELDCAGIQLLLLAKRESDRLGKPMRLVKHSAAALDAIDTCQLGGYFGDPVVIFNAG